MIIVVAPNRCDATGEKHGISDHAKGSDYTMKRVTTISYSVPSTVTRKISLSIFMMVSFTP